MAANQMDVNMTEASATEVGIGALLLRFFVQTSPPSEL